jgi:AcrR family transcriptional regulator
MRVPPRSNRNVRTRILEEAVRLFSEKGFDGTSIQLIADAVGIRKPSLLYHFKSKEKLREAVYERLMVHWKNELPKQLTANVTDKDRFASIITSLVKYFLKDIHRSRMSIREMLDRPEIVKNILHNQLNPWIKLICEYIEMGKGNGVVRPDVQPEGFIIHTIILVLGIVALGNVLSALFDNSENAESQSIETFIEELERMLRISLFEPQYLQNTQSS